MKSKFELEHIGINTPNPEEAEKLAGEEYQTIVAEVVADGVVSYIESGEELFSR